MAQPLTDQQMDIAAVMKMIEAEVMKLAPEPGGQRGFIYATADARAGGNGDDLVGDLIAEQMLGVATGGATFTLGGLDAGNVIDIADEFYVDRAKTNINRSNAFKMSFGAASTGSFEKAMEMAFESDLPRRVQLERQYMILARKLDDAMNPEFNFDPKYDLDPDLALERHHTMGMF